MNASRKLLVSGIATVLLLCGILSVADASITVQEKGFRLSNAPGSREALQFEVAVPGKVRLAAGWTGPAGTLALILNGPGRETYYARKDGGSLLKLEYEVKREDLRGGATWTATIANFSGRGPVEGTLRAVYAAGPAFTYDFLGDYPRDREPGWSEECQGIANDDDSWYISQRFTLWKFPRRFDLNTGVSGADPARGIRTAEIPRFLRDRAYDHFGDPDYYQGRLFVPLEGSAGHSRPCQLLVFDARTLRYLSAADMGPQPTNAPWCAISPWDGLLYSSPFDGVAELTGYQMSFRGDALTLTPVRGLRLFDEFGEPTHVDRVQGGAFSPGSGLIYLVSDTGSDGGIFVFDARTGIKVGRIWIGYKTGWGQELEGVAVCPSGGAPGIGGQVHTVMISNDTGTDDMWIKHHRVPYELAASGGRPPSVISVQPSSGAWSAAGSSLEVILRGTNFYHGAGLDFGPGVTVRASELRSPADIRAVIFIAPTASLGPRDVSVRTSFGAGTLRNAFTVRPAATPRITSITPSSAPRGSSVEVTISGDNLFGATAVDLGPGITVESFSVIRPSTETYAVRTTLRISPSASLGSRSVAVTRDDAVTGRGSSFTVTAAPASAAPVVTSVSPASRMQSRSLEVVVRGTGFDGATAVSFGAGVAVSDFRVVNSNEIRATVSIATYAAIGPRNVTVTAPSGTGVGRGLFRVEVLLE